MRLVRLRDEDGEVVYVNPEQVAQVWVCEVDLCVKISTTGEALPMVTLSTDDIEGVVELLTGDTSASQPADPSQAVAPPNQPPVQAPPRDEDVIAVDLATLSVLPLLPFPIIEGGPMRWDHVVVAFEVLSMEHRSDVLAAFSRANERAVREEQCWWV